MRFIIHEMPYETPLTAGQWKYVLDGQATGALEQWRLTEAVDGYRFLRVDLDARAAQSGRSYIYHITVDEYGNPIQLKYRLWAAGLEIVGTVLLEEDVVIVTRETAGERQEDVLKVPYGYAFWFPATAGLALLTGLAEANNVTAVTLRTAAADPALLMGPVSTTLDIREDKPKAIDVMGTMQTLRTITIKWQNHRRRLWVDAGGWPLKMERDDELTAVTTQAIKYQRIIKPGVNPDQQLNAD
jgi:hypothetical protein